MNPNDAKFVGMAKRPKGNGLVNQFPGLDWSANMTIEQVRDFIKNQKRVKGELFSIAAGVQGPFQIQLSGDARVFLGLSIISMDPTGLLESTLYPDQVTLQINNENVITTVAGFTLANVWRDEEYSSFPRPLSGQDDISLTFRNPTLVAQNISVSFYYI